MPGVDPDARRIGPRSFSAFRRARGLNQIFTHTFWPGIHGVFSRWAAARKAITRFSRGAPQALTIVGHNFVTPRRATTGRSGSIAMDPAARGLLDESLRIDTR